MCAFLNLRKSCLYNDTTHVGYKKKEKTYDMPTESETQSLSNGRILIGVKLNVLNRICHFHKYLKKHFVQEIDMPIH